MPSSHYVIIITSSFLITITSSSLVVACLFLSQPFYYGCWFFGYWGYYIYSKFHLIRGIFPFRLDDPARNSEMKVELTFLTVYLCNSRCESRFKQLHSFTYDLIPCVMFFTSLCPTSLLVGRKGYEVKWVRCLLVINWNFGYERYWSTVS